MMQMYILQDTHHWMDFRKSIAEDSAFTISNIDASPRADCLLALLED
jgi:hypothetical protein